MSDNYGKILLAYKSIGQAAEGQADPMDKCHSKLQFKTKIILNSKMDEQFYEFLIKLYIATLRRHPAFTSEADKNRVAEEIARLFRGNVFNKNRREHAVLEEQDRHPILKEDLLKNLVIKNREKRHEFIEKMQARQRIPK